MPSRIHLLPEELIVRIAAGEVVERPASIVKELVENSLDAGADRLVVAYEGAGRKLISVSDNGSGMTIGEALLSLQRHATSKISSFEDLESLSSFGFRGEALPSIAAVSRLRIIVRSPNEELGWEIAVEGGKIVSERPVPREPGTTIEVRDTFFNTPARFKFLKSDVTERGQILRVMEEMIFSSPGVTFEIHSEKTRPAVFQGFQFSNVERKTEILRTRMADAWGARWARGLQPVISKTPHFSVYGMVTNQGFHQATPRSQFLFVNRRPVANRRLTRAVYDAYTGQLPSLRHPGWVLFLDVDPKTVDVNVHPSKREVKLTHEGEIFQFLLAAVKQALSHTSEVPVEAFTSIAPSLAPSGFLAPRPASGGMARPSVSSRPTAAESQAVFKNLVRPVSSETGSGEPSQGSLFVNEGQKEGDLSDLKDPDMAIVSQVRQTFILAHTSTGLLIVDQHAAAEKAAYERLLSNLKAQDPQVQMLLVPFSWEVSMSVAPQVEGNLNVFKKLGYFLEPFGGNTFLIKGVPAHLGERFDLHSLLDGLSDVLMETEDRRGGVDRNIEHRLAAMTACKASVKAGDSLTIKECRTILQRLSECEAPFTCPHGRPTVVRLPFVELERRFRRT